MTCSVCFIYLLLQFCFSTLNAQGTVRVIPQSRLVATLHGNAVFTCVCGGTGYVVTHVKWFANEGVLLENRNVEIQFHPVPQIGQLRYTNLSMEYNMTRIQCSTVFDNGNNMTSDDSLLLIQGYLSAVTNVTATMNDHLTYLTWTAPPSLDFISGYCVDIRSNSSMIFSECGITETEFNFTLPSYSACNNYTFTLTPVNDLGNGTNITGSYSGTKPNLSGLILATRNTYILTMSASVCYSELAFEDIDTGEMGTLGDADVTENTITFSTGQLIGNRHYNVTVTATNAAGLNISYIIISTHGVMNATAIKKSNNIIEVTTLYSEHSDARGALFDFVFIDDDGDVDFTRSVLLALDRNTSLHHTLPFNLYPGQYRVFVYDIESDGTLSNGVGYPAVTKKLESQDFSSQSEFTDIETCFVTTSPGVISAKCTSPSGFQMVAQSSDSTKVHELHINQTMDLQTPVTVEVEESGVYQVTIFSIRNNVGIVDSHVLHEEEVNVGNTSSLVLWVIVVLLVVLIIVIMVTVVLMVIAHKRLYCLKCWNSIYPKKNMDPEAGYPRKTYPTVDSGYGSPRDVINHEDMVDPGDGSPRDVDPTGIVIPMVDIRIQIKDNPIPQRSNTRSCNTPCKNSPTFTDYRNMPPAEVAEHDTGIVEEITPTWIPVAECQLQEMHSPWSTQDRR